jgi:hypothetical protein
MTYPSFTHRDRTNAVDEGDAAGSRFGAHNTEADEGPVTNLEASAEDVDREPVADLDNRETIGLNDREDDFDDGVDARENDTDNADGDEDDDSVEDDEDQDDDSVDDAAARTDDLHAAEDTDEDTDEDADEDTDVEASDRAGRGLTDSDAEDAAADADSEIDDGHGVDAVDSHGIDAVVVTPFDVEDRTDAATESESFDNPAETPIPEVVDTVSGPVIVDADVADATAPDASDADADPDASEADAEADADAAATGDTGTLTRPIDDEAVADGAVVVVGEVVDEDGYAGRAPDEQVAPHEQVAADEQVINGEQVIDGQVVEQVTPSGNMRPGDAPLSEAAGSLVDSAALRERWQQAQLGFIDDPHGSATAARAIAAESLEGHIAALRARQTELDSWQDDAAPDTEVLRAAMRGYRDLVASFTEA